MNLMFPPCKRVKIESEQFLASCRNAVSRDAKKDTEADEDELRCAICLQEIIDSSVVPTCSHEFCFECILQWSEQSRKCPLCSQPIGSYLIHDIHSKYDFRKYFLPPLRTSPLNPTTRGLRDETMQRRRAARASERERRRHCEESDRLQQSIEWRKYIYRYGLYAKHVASNPHTRYRPFPTPAQFSASQDYLSRTIVFLRRELQVWDDLDVEFLAAFVISLMKSIDIRSDSAIKLLAEFLDLDSGATNGREHPNAEHFAHEIYSYVRSPFRDLFVYDSVVQYDEPFCRNEELPDRLGQQEKSRRLPFHSPLAPEPRPSLAQSFPLLGSISDGDPPCPGRPRSRKRAISSSPSSRPQSPRTRHSPPKDTDIAAVQPVPNRSESADAVTHSSDVGYSNNTRDAEDPYEELTAVSLGSEDEDMEHSDIVEIPGSSPKVTETSNAPNVPQRSSTSQTQVPGTSCETRSRRSLGLIASIREHLSRNADMKNGAHCLSAPDSQHFGRSPTLLARLSDPVVNEVEGKVLGESDRSVRLVLEDSSPVRNAQGTTSAVRFAEFQGHTSGSQSQNLSPPRARKLSKPGSVSQSYRNAFRPDKDPCSDHSRHGSANSLVVASQVEWNSVTSVSPPILIPLSSPNVNHQAAEKDCVRSPEDHISPRDRQDQSSVSCNLSSTSINNRSREHQSSLEKRASLLSRLVKERHLVSDCPSCPENFQALEVDSAQDPGSKPFKDVEDPIVFEAKLRMRAQLRVRLAAAKRVGPSEPI